MEAVPTPRHQGKPQARRAISLKTSKKRPRILTADELQRDLQRELTYDGPRAAEAKGSKGGRRPGVPAAKTDVVRTAYLEGRSRGSELATSRNRESRIPRL
ncbi:hypothetical protein [Wenjunlia tyrosinilytica]|uniref:Uncharacterized protein n=1 Tax=Wenjunlia tyrosinilytica TaxID=1544741 RepID=A0A918A0J3_9ACTN|nr:hypothetical protein GCM10012280_71220 [Wenjunlia tyrosinilytica]